ncbi:hypothetical protein L226DRAFT_310721 [Lentinus tigrinus ALCF2SS1-7]|uniref:Uncharacterized protein n=1 Tax=Lentinus tigrinus ALCF2SS1-6 TaxID=1328759 RepID=A0A5C2S513_9APHY|nr:hypothetical protein L227DRAFT_175532 [Lentinus tigrinus ALCF2SS1-6]RPD68936.1 hypothetical protein L226DRAFT_310721 [Lentinus tigrinus ALCF2SS1-7]
MTLLSVYVRDRRITLASRRRALALELGVWTACCVRWSLDTWTWMMGHGIFPSPSPSARSFVRGTSPFLQQGTSSDVRCSTVCGILNICATSGMGLGSVARGCGEAYSAGSRRRWSLINVIRYVHAAPITK